MAHIGSRITRLERIRPDPVTGAALDLDLPPDTCARILAAKAAGTYPQSLTDSDLEAIVAAADKARGRA